jgi:hypothetical protein
VSTSSWSIDDDDVVDVDDVVVVMDDGAMAEDEEGAVMLPSRPSPIPRCDSDRLWKLDS